MMMSICECMNFPVYQTQGEWQCLCGHTYDEEWFNSKVLWIKDREADHLRSRISELEANLAKFQPVDAILVEDCDEGSDKRYGRVLVSTENCIRTLYRNMAFDAAIASAPEVK